MLVPLTLGKLLTTANCTWYDDKLMLAMAVMVPGS